MIGKINKIIMFQIFCMLSLCLYLSQNNAAFAKRRSGKSANQQIDAFIDRLLASDKFQKITDEIVNKTVSRLKSIDQDPIYRHSIEVETKNDEAITHKADHSAEKKDVKVTGVTVPDLVSPIDSKDFLKDKSSEKLLLHYKHFNKDSKKGIESANKPENKPSPAKKPSDIEIFDEPVKIESGDKSSIEEDNDSYDEKKKINFNDEASSFEKRKKKQMKKRKQSNIKKTKKMNAESSELKKMRHYLVKNRPKSSEKDHIGAEGISEKTLKSDSKQTKSDGKTPKENDNKLKFRSRMSDIEIIHPPPENDRSKEIANLDESHGHEDIFKSEENEAHTTPQMKMHLIREENGKNYTFNSSPEYHEYHEKLAELQETTYNFANL